MKFAIVSTWNGEGYSYQNTAEVRDFKDVYEAQEYNLSLVDGLKLDNLDKCDVMDLSHITYDIGDDSGTFQVHEILKDSVGIVIKTNVNEVMVVNKREWTKMYSDAILQGDPAEFEDDEFELDFDGRAFIGAYDGDYDFQFIAI